MSKKKALDSEIEQKRIRKSFDDSFKVKVVLEALKETMTITELSSKYAVHPNQIFNWKKRFLERSVMFSAGAARNSRR